MFSLPKKSLLTLAAANVGLALLSFAPQDREDATPPHPDDHLVTARFLRIYEGDGTKCKKFDLRNIDTNPQHSRQEVTVKWDDNVMSTAEIIRGQHIIRECYIHSVSVRERVTGTSTIRMSEIK